ncbi:MAG TPA: hypothetical protein DCW68_02230 [Rhodospirillaceae bacterium]|nr:MAG: hypothetical protein A2018_05195 [Alphaproteobacteria bacterium GWF2_58_20]HAU28912.1 hypothetical protein [Rhodospirillaceae bacterium]
MRQSLKSWLLGGVAALGLAAALSAAPEPEVLRSETVKPVKKLVEAFNRAEQRSRETFLSASLARMDDIPAGFMLEGTKVEQMRLAEIVRRAQQSFQGKRLFGQDVGTDWRLMFFEDMLRARQFHGETHRRMETVFLSQLYQDDELVPTLLHEMTHVQQFGLGLMQMSNRSLSECFLEYKVSEAIARTVGTEAAWQMGGQAWASCLSRDAQKPLAEAWECAYAANPETATESARLAVFDAFFDSPLCTVYENACMRILEDMKREAKAEGRVLAWPGDTYESPDLVASMSLNGLGGVSRQLPGFSKKNTRYSGVSSATHAKLAVLFPGAKLPGVRTRAPVLPPAMPQEPCGHDAEKWVFLMGVLGAAGIAVFMRRREAEIAQKKRRHSGSDVPRPGP